MRNHFRISCNVLAARTCLQHLVCGTVLVLLLASCTAENFDRVGRVSYVQLEKTCTPKSSEHLIYSYRDIEVFENDNGEFLIKYPIDDCLYKIPIDGLNADQITNEWLHRTPAEDLFPEHERKIRQFISLSQGPLRDRYEEWALDCLAEFNRQFEEIGEENYTKELIDCIEIERNLQLHMVFFRGENRIFVEAFYDLAGVLVLE